MLKTIFSLSLFASLALAALPDDNLCSPVSHAKIASICTDAPFEPYEKLLIYKKDKTVCHFEIVAVEPAKSPSSKAIFRSQNGELTSMAFYWAESGYEQFDFYGLSLEDGTSVLEFRRSKLVSSQPCPSLRELGL